MELAYRKLSDDEIRQEAAKLDQWAVVDEKISKEFSFEDYASGLAFASAVGFIADLLNHHPDLHIGYRKVRVAVNTHDVGGLSPYDFELARRVEGLVNPPA